MLRNDMTGERCDMRVRLGAKYGYVLSCYHSLATTSHDTTSSFQRVCFPGSKEFNVPRE